jgi:HPt (histidine-containing phosphotransfer) domain-containing protein
LYDSSRLLAEDEDDRHFIQEMLRVFLERIPPAAEEMREAYAASDLARVHKLAHRIKPSIRELDIRSLKATIAQIESEAAEGAPSQALRGSIDYFCGVIERVKAQMQAELDAPTPLP